MNAMEPSREPVRRPVVWSIAGTDSGGGAGLSADERIAEACGVHLCPVVAAITAQNSLAVSQVQAVTPDLLDAQLAALFDDMPPQAVKTGLLGDAELLPVIARWMDRLRARDRAAGRAPTALVIDPVLRATTGADFADARYIEALRRWLLPRATVVTPNRHEARRLVVGAGPDGDRNALPRLARALRESGAGSVVITGGDVDDHPPTGAPGSSIETDRATDWLATPQAEGWLVLPRVDTAHDHGTGCTHATALAAALARGFVEADAAVIAKMATTAALRAGRSAGQGAGPVGIPASGWIADPSLLPLLSWGDAPQDVTPLPNERAPLAPAAPVQGLYAFAADAQGVARLLAAGVSQVQLRIKRPVHADAQWESALAVELRLALAAHRQACEVEGTEIGAAPALWINDHAALALEMRATALHLGQEDLDALGEDGRAALRRQRALRGVRLGISSHSLWELCRAAAMSPGYIACGPVWPTTTKDMPWHPQGLGNLAWWARVAPVPVVAIGGILTTGQAREAAAAGAGAVCVLRGLGEGDPDTVASFRGAIEAGAQLRRLGEPAWPHPSLDRPVDAW